MKPPQTYDLQDWRRPLAANMNRPPIAMMLGEWLPPRRPPRQKPRWRRQLEAILNLTRGPT